MAVRAGSPGGFRSAPGKGHGLRAVRPPATPLRYAIDVAAAGGGHGGVENRGWWLRLAIRFTIAARWRGWTRPIEICSRRWSVGRIGSGSRAITIRIRRRDWAGAASGRSPCSNSPCGTRQSRVESGGEISGHLHPCARVASRGGSVRRRCFATDGARMVMPAFGSYAGGLNVRDDAFTAAVSERLPRADARPLTRLSGRAPIGLSAISA